MNWVKSIVRTMQSLVEKPWYPFVLAIVIALDTFVIVLPTDGLMISSVLAKPAKWLSFSIAVIVGALLGAMVLAWSVESYGLTLLHYISADFEKSSAWIKAIAFADKYGDYAVVFTGFSPMAQQPAVVLAALAKMPLPKLGLLLLIGRSAKYLLLGWISAKSPRLIQKIWKQPNVAGQSKNPALK